MKLLGQQIVLLIGSIVIAPLFICLFFGRLVFFGLLGICGWLQEQIHMRLNKVVPATERADLLPFWAAWAMAVAVIAGLLGGVAIVLNATRSWTGADQASLYGVLILSALAGLYAAFRLALYGTSCLQRVLAHNLARLIALELSDLRAAAEQRSHSLNADPLAAPFAPAAPALPVPRFFRDAEDIGALLGEPTERALEDLLASLTAFNRALDAVRHHRPTRGTAARQQACHDLRRQLASVHDCLTAAMLVVNPLCRARA